MSGIGVIVNPRAARASWCQRFARILGNSGNLRVTGSLSELDRIAAAFLRSRIDVLCIGGGDGSNQRVLTSLIKVYADHPLPRVVFLRAGTHNACAKSIGQTGAPQAILSRLVHRHRRARPMKVIRRCLLRISHGQVIHYGFTLSTGFLYRYFRELHAGGRPGPLRSAGLLVTLMGKSLLGNLLLGDMFRLVPVRLTLGGVVMPWDKYNGAAASTMEQVGLGFRPFSRAGETPGSFQAMCFRMRPAALLRAAPALASGRMRSDPDHLNTLTDSLLIESTEPVPYALDGDIFPGSLRIRISTGPLLELMVV